MTKSFELFGFVELFYSKSVYLSYLSTLFVLFILFPILLHPFELHLILKQENAFSNNTALSIINYQNIVLSIKLKIISVRFKTHLRKVQLLRMKETKVAISQKAATPILT